MNYQQGNPLLNAALAYARAGVAVFPLRPAGKQPLFSSAHPGDPAARDACQPPVCGQVGHGLWDATTDLEVITRWWTSEPSANIGIAAGLSGLLVVDIDTKDGKPGADTLNALEEQYGSLPATYMVQTWSGGWHYYFQMPTLRLGNTAGTDRAGLGLCIDTRGDGGYVVAAPSAIQEDGKQGAYSVLAADPFAPLPAWVMEKLTKAKKTFVLPGRRAAAQTFSGRSMDMGTGLILEGFRGTPAGLQRYVEKKLAAIRELPVDGPGETPVNEIAFELSHFVPHQLELEPLREQLRTAVDSWEDGQESGYKGIDNGLRDAGQQEPRVWEETSSFTGGRTDTSASGRITLAHEDAGSLLPPPYVPDEVVERLLPVWQKDGVPTLRRWRSDWMRWRGTHWRAQNGEAVRAELYPLLKGKKYATPAGRIEPWGANRNKVADLLEVMASVTYLDQDTEPGTWIKGEGPSGIIAVRNGLLNVRTHEVIGHTPRFFNITSLPFEYDAKAPEPKSWLAFLQSIWAEDPEAVETFHEWAAYVLSGRTDLQKMMLLIGPKRSGKGTLARILTALVGKENVGGPSMGDFAKNFGLAELVGKPLAIIGDARMPNAGEREIVSQLLSISGEDTIRADRKNREAWVGRLPTRIFILSNELPSFADSSGAIASRFVILRMTKSFIGLEDSSLENRLMAELPGILNMVLAAGERLESRGYIAEPASSETARSIFSEMTSPIETFLAEMCKENPDPDAVTSSKELYGAWQDWCKANGREAYIGVPEGFSKKLLSAQPRLRRVRPRVNGKQVPHYQGIELLPPGQRGSFTEMGSLFPESGFESGQRWTNPQVDRVETGETGWSGSVPTGSLPRALKEFKGNG